MPTVPVMSNEEFQALEACAGDEEANGSVFCNALTEERHLGLYNVCLRRMFGHQDFRGVQADALLEWGVRRRDAVVVWRTGGGKTAIFAIPAIFHDGLTVVVLPLISLIEDVYRQLMTRRIGVVFLHHQLRADQCQYVLVSLCVFLY